GPRLAGIPKSQFIGFRQPPSSYCIDSNRLFPRCALQNHCIQVLYPPSQLRPPAQHIIQLLHFLVNRRRALEIQFFAGLLAFRFKSSAQRAPARLQERHQPVHLHVVLFLCATRKTRRQAHFHLGIQASRKGGVAPRTAHSKLPPLATLAHPPQCAVSRSSAGKHCANSLLARLLAGVASGLDIVLGRSVWRGDSRSAPAQMPTPSRGTARPAQTRAGSTACSRDPPGPAVVAGAAASPLSVSSTALRFLPGVQSGRRPASPGAAKKTPRRLPL